MMEIFDELSVIGDTISEEDHVVYLLASLPESFSVLVTALEANPEVPKMELVTERLLHEERKAQERMSGTGESHDGAMIAKNHQKRSGPRCHYCHRLGHVRRNCPERSSDQERKLPTTSTSHKALRRNTSRQHIHQVSVNEDDASSNSDVVGLVIQRALSVKVRV